MWILSDYVPAKSRLIQNIPSNSVLYVSNGKYGRKKTDICDHCNESVGCWNARLSSQVCLQQSYKLDFGNG